MVRFFVDENDLALGKALREFNREVVYPGHDDSPVERGATDDEWLPIIGDLDLVVITRDKRIRYRPVEKQMWLRHSVRGFVLTGRTSQSTADSLDLVIRRWAEINELVAAAGDGPWMFGLTASGLRRIDL